MYCGVEGREVAVGRCANDVSAAKEVDEEDMLERVRFLSGCCLP